MTPPRVVGPEGRYELGRLLGQGGMGLLYEARDHVLRRRVAVKLIQPELLSNPDIVSRFRREALMLARMDHPNLVRIYGVELDAPPAYLVMEVLEGEDLESRLAAGRRLDAGEARRVAAELAEALAALHERGIVHRDVKPANVFLESDGRVRLLDLGLALPLDATRITLQGALVGTVIYLAPEVVAGGLASPASDVYQVGLVVHVAVAGHLPFEGHDDLEGLPGRILSGPPPTIVIAPAVPADLAALLRACLARDPSARPHDGRALATLLAATPAKAAAPRAVGAALTGQVFGGRYRLLRHLGAGGMAEVWLADDLTAGRSVAVKVLARTGDGSDEYARRFKREFASCAALDHLNLVKLFEAGSTPEGVSWFAMEYLPGETFDQVLRARGRLDVPATLAVCRQVAAALAHLHGRGLFHRDLKPGNVMVGPDGRAVLMDFGLVHDESGTALTETGTLLGTPSYLPPEMLLGKGSGAEGDVYQFGLLAYELLSGRRAFRGASLSEVSLRIANGRCAPLGSLVPGLPPALASLVAKCMAPEPGDRYPDGAAVEAALCGLGEGTEGCAPPPVPATAAGAPPQRRRLGWVAAAGALLLLSALLVRPDTEAPPTPTGPRSAPRLLDVKRAGLGLRFRWRATHGAPAVLSVRARKVQVATAPAVAEDQDTWSASLEGLPLLADELVVTPGAGPGAWPEVNLGPALTAEARAVARRLASFDPAPLTHRATDFAEKDALLRFEGAPAKAGRDEPTEFRDRAEAELDRRVRGAASLADYRRASELSPAVFRARLVPLDEQLDLHEALQKHWSVYLFARFEKLDCPALLPVPLFGRFAVAADPLPGSVAETVILTCAPGHALKLTSGLDASFRGTRRWRGTFRVKAPALATAAELCVRYERFARVAVRLDLNGRFRTLLYSRPLVAPRAAGLRRVFQRLDPAWLRDGDNQLDLEAEPLFKRYTPAALELQSIELRLLHGDGPAGGPVLSDAEPEHSDE